MPVVEETVLDPESSPIEGAIVGVRLAISSNGSLNTLYGSSGTYLFSATTETDASGHWQLTLEPNVNLSPSGSVYEVFVEDPNRSTYPTHRVISVPDEAGPLTVSNLIVATDLQPVSVVQGPAGDAGPGLEYDWDGTQLGVRVEGDVSYDYVDLQGPSGDAGEHDHSEAEITNLGAYPDATGQDANKVAETDGAGGWTFIATPTGGGAHDHDTLYPTQASFDDHSARHEDAGADEINVAGLSGVLADAQVPQAHDLAGATHNSATLAELNAKVSDATLDDSSDTRTPASHGNEAHSTAFVAPGDDADTLGSGDANNGQVLTSDGAGAAVWEDAAGGGFDASADPVVIGDGATNSSAGGVSVGSNAGHATGVEYPTQVGKDTRAPRQGIAVGGGADAGTSALLGSGQRTVIGANASATNGRNGVAIGNGASVGHDYAIALGSTTSAADQVHIGGRHIALTEITNPATPPTGEARLFLRDDGTGKQELCAIFDGGAVAVIAAE